MKIKHIYIYITVSSVYLRLLKILLQKLKPSNSSIALIINSVHKANR